MFREERSDTPPSLPFLLSVTRERLWTGKDAVRHSKSPTANSRSLTVRSAPPSAHRPAGRAALSPSGMEKDASEADPSRHRNGPVGVLYGEFTDMLNDRVRYSVSLTESALSIQKVSSSPGRTKVVFHLTDCVGCRAHRGPEGADVGAYFTVYFYPFKRRWMSAGVSRQRVEQCFRVALVQDPIANLREAEMWARAIREASVLQAPRRDGESESSPLTWHPQVISVFGCNFVCVHIVRVCFLPSFNSHRPSCCYKLV